jgi:hypothetical protein
MTRQFTRSSALLGLGVVLLVAPALFPIQPVLYHDTGPRTLDNRTQLQEQGYEIITYENLSDRGQELYVQTLRNGGEYTVPLGEGAADFAYPTAGDLGNVSDYRERNALRSVVIERSANTDLPPPDEPVEAAEHRKERAEERGTEDNMSVEEHRQMIARYDVMTTRTDHPPLTTPTPLARLLSTVLGVLALATGGYLRSLP